MRRIPVPIAPFLMCVLTTLGVGVAVGRNEWTRLSWVYVGLALVFFFWTLVDLGRVHNSRVSADPNGTDDA